MQQVEDFIKKQLNSNVSKEDIETSLLSAGWSKADIEKAFELVESPNKDSVPVPPKAETQLPLNAEMKKLPKKAYWIFFISSAWGWVIYITIIFTILFISTFSAYQNLNRAGHILEGFAIILIIIYIFIAIVYLIIAKLKYDNYSYGLSDIGLRIQRGIISRNITTIPYERIQSADIYRDIFHRVIGLSMLIVQTAGTYGSVGGFRSGLGGGRLIGLTTQDAESLQMELLTRSKQSSSNSGI